MPDDVVAALRDAVVAWAKTEARIRGVALVGSRARGAATPDSDIDLVLLTTDPLTFRADITWLNTINWSPTHVRPATWHDIQYGNVWSRHICFDDMPEVEFSFASLSWIDCPPDAGTRDVISGGCRVLYDPDGLFATLVASVADAAARQRGGDQKAPFSLGESAGIC